MSERKYIKTDKNGTKIYHDYTCPRCGGAGGSDKWAYTGWKCYECNGSGKRYDKPQIIKEYTPEYRAKLDERARKRQEKARLERVKEFKNNLSKLIQDQGFNKQGKLYVAIGDTYHVKEQLKEAGAHWFPAFCSWVFTERPNKFETVELTYTECLQVNEFDGWLSWKNINFRELIESKIPKKDVKESQHIGEIGDKLDIEVNCARLFNYEKTSFKGWGTEIATIYKFIDNNDNVLVWNTTAYVDVQEGDTVRLKGTVSEHSEYKGEKQTVLKRCKIEQLMRVGA